MTEKQKKAMHLARLAIQRLFVYGSQIFTKEARQTYWHETLLTLEKVLDNEESA